jgi:hypothetical protein
MSGDDQGKGSRPPSGGAPGGPSDETIARLRSRAEQLQAARRIRQQAPPPEPEPEPEPESEPSPPPADASVAELDVAGRAAADVQSLDDLGTDEDHDGEDPFAGMLAPGAPLRGAEDLVGGADPFAHTGRDPEADRLMDRWADEERDESVEPGRNWTPVVALVVVLVVVGLGFLGARALISGSADDDTASGGLPGRDDGGASVLDEDTPSLEDLTSDVTLPPGPDAGLQVVEQGITVVPDRFDESKREGTYAVVFKNPHDEWLAQGVQVTVSFLDEAGAPLGGDDGFVEVVLPGQSVAVAELFFDAPTVAVVGLDVQVEVARWRETGPISGIFSITEVQTAEAEFSGVRTTFQIQSNFEEPLTDVGVTAVYRGADGRIIGGYDAFVERLDPGVPTPAEIDLLANVDPAQIASTELYPTAAFGSVPE